MLGCKATIFQFYKNVCSAPGQHHIVLRYTYRIIYAVMQTVSQQRPLCGYSVSVVSPLQLHCYVQGMNTFELCINGNIQAI